MPDKDGHIDDFVKKVVESYQVQYDERHWQQLESRLDAEMPASASDPGAFYYNGGNLLSAIAIAVCLLTGTLYSSFEHSTGASATASFSTAPVLAEREPPNTPVTDMQAPKPIVPTPSVRSTTTLQGSSQDLPTQEESRSAHRSVPSEESVKTIASHEISTGSEGKSARQDAQSVDETSSVYMVLEELEPEVSSQYVAVDQAILPPSYSYPEGPEVAVDNDLVTVLQGKLICFDVQSQRKQMRSLGVAVSVAPDMNSVAMQEKKMLSLQRGIQVYYEIGGRWVFSTGLLQNRKRYVTDGENYSPGSGYWYGATNGNVPEKVDGNCSVIDVPVNVSYNWISGPRFRLFTTAGLSNYWLLDEYYEFEFADDDPGAAHGWSTEENSRVMWGVTNLSVGVEWYLNPRLALRAEPYIKMPFKTMGWGNVQLYGTGTLFSLRYNLISKP